jgi:hypothetical protein
MAARAGNRMQMRQAYRTASRMQRRRSYVAGKTGMRQDFEPYQDQQSYEQAPPQAAPAASDYTQELQELAGLRDQGVITAEEFDAKKKQLLGI